MKPLRWIPSLAAVWIATVATQLTFAAPPIAPKHAAEDRYWGVPVTDDYRWLENWSDPEVKSWVDSQNAWTRGALDHLPARPEILKRVESLSRSLTPRYFGLDCKKGVIFALKDQPPKNQAMLVRLDSPNDLSTERMLVDPNTLDATGSTTVDFYVPSLDGSKVAVSLSKGGTESGDIHIYDTRTGQELPDVIPHVNGGTAGGSVAWNKDGTALWYTRYPAAGERPEADRDFYQQLWYHTLGQPLSSDQYVVGKEFPKIAEIAVETADDGEHVLIEVKNGDGGEIAYLLREPGGQIVPVAGFKERVKGAAFTPDGLFLLSRKTNANGEVLRVPFENPVLSKAKSVVPASETAIDEIHVAGSRLYVVDIVGGPSEVRMFTLAGAPLGKLPLAPVSSLSGFTKLSGDAVPTRIARMRSNSPANSRKIPNATEITVSVFPGYTIMRTPTPRDARP